MLTLFTVPFIDHALPYFRRSFLSYHYLLLKYYTLLSMLFVRSLPQ